MLELSVLNKLDLKESTLEKKCKESFFCTILKKIKAFKPTLPKFQPKNQYLKAISSDLKAFFKKIFSQGIFQKIAEAPIKLNQKIRELITTLNLEPLQNVLLFFLFIALIFAPSTTIGVLAVLLFGVSVFKIIVIFCLRHYEEGKARRDNLIERDPHVANAPQDDGVHTFSTIDFAIMLYVLIVFLSVLFSPLFASSLKGFAKLLVYLGAYFSFRVFFNSEKKIYFILALISLLAGFEAIIGIIQHFFGVQSFATWQDVNTPQELLLSRVYGTLNPLNPNLYAGFLVSVFPFSLACAVISYIKKYYRTSILFASIFSASIFAIIFSGSRGAYIALSAMILAIVIFSGYFVFQRLRANKKIKKRKRIRFLWVLMMAAFAIFIVGYVLSSESLLHRISSILTLRGDSSNAFRMNVYASSFKMLADNFLIGIGAGNETFRLIYGLYMKAGFDALSAYNIFLEIAIESGVFAMLAFVWVIFLAIIRGIKYIYSQISLKNKIITASLVIALLGMMTHGMFDTVFFRSQLQIIFWMIIAMVVYFCTDVKIKELNTN